MSAHVPNSSPAVTSGTIRSSYGHLASGIALIAALIEGEPVGLVASSFTTVSWEPPLVSFCVQNTSRTWARLVDVPRIGVSLLAHVHEPLAHQLASRNRDRFAGVPTNVTAQGSVLLDGAPARFDCSVESVIEAGDHSIVLMRVHETWSHEVEPLLYHRSSLRRLAVPA